MAETTTEADGHPGEAVAAAYAGFATADETYVVEVIQCTPSGVGEYARAFEAALEERRAVSEGLVPIAAWQTVCGTSDEITHVYAFPGVADLDDGAAGLLLGHDMPAATVPWQRARSVRLAKKVPYGQPLVEVARDLQARPPAPARIYHVMSVDGTRSGIGDFVAHFGAGIPHRRELGANLVPVAGWQTLYGDVYFEVNHVYAYDSLADMEHLRKVLHGDAYFREHNKVNTSPHPPNYWFSGASSKLFRALPYSQL